MEDDDYRIRRCLPDDVLALVALQQHWAAEDNVIGMVAATAEEVRQWLDQCCWVAEAQGRIIGFACGTVQTSDGLAVIHAVPRAGRLRAPCFRA